MADSLLMLISESNVLNFLLFSSVDLKQTFDRAAFII